MRDLEPIGDELVGEVDHVAIAVVREFSLEPIGRLGRPAAPERVGHDDEILAGVERLARLEQFVGKRRAQPVGAGAGIALQQQHTVDNLPGGVSLRGPERAVMEFDFRQGLAAGKFVVADGEIALGVVGPVGVGLVGCLLRESRRDKADESGGSNQNAELHRSRFSQNHNETVGIIRSSRYSAASARVGPSSARNSTR